MTEEGELYSRLITHRAIWYQRRKAQGKHGDFTKETLDEAKKDFDMALDDLIRNDAHLPIYAMIKKWFGGCEESGGEVIQT